tara:strand:- start:250 stop:420 length:171 start_codon:yes stop_codon:yes gene_type:complete
MNKLINSLNKQGYDNIKNIINGLDLYKVITSNTVITINKNTLDIVDIYQDLTNGGK